MSRHIIPKLVLACSAVDFACLLAPLATLFLDPSVTNPCGRERAKATAWRSVIALQHAETLCQLNGRDLLESQLKCHCLVCGRDQSPWCEQQTVVRVLYMSSRVCSFSIGTWGSGM